MATEAIARAPWAGAPGPASAGPASPQGATPPHTQSSGSAGEDVVSFGGWRAAPYSPTPAARGSPAGAPLYEVGDRVEVDFDDSNRYILRRV